MSEQIVAAFWEAMATNDFAHASTWLHRDFEHYMPQSCEYLRGPSAFAAFNAAYPAQGRWTFAVNTIVADANRAVSDVSVSDGHMNARAITFHWIKEGLIWRQKEFWPDPYAAQDWRAQWVEILDADPF